MKQYIVGFFIIFALSAPAARAANSIPVGNSAYFSTLVGTKLYVGNYDSNNLSVIDTNTNQVIKTIPVGAGPEQTTVAGNFLYVSNNNFGDGGNTVSVIDTTLDMVVATTTVGDNPNASVLSGTKVYVARQSGFVSVLDTKTHALLYDIQAGGNPLSATLVGTELYVANYDSKDITVIDTLSDTVRTTITTGEKSPYVPLFTGNKVYVLNQGAGTVSVLDATTHAILATIAVGLSPNYASYSQGKIYVSNSAANTLSVIDGASDQVIKTIVVGEGPAYSAMVGQKLYVTNRHTDTVSVIDTTTDNVVATITVGSSPDWAIVVGSKLFVMNGGGSVSVINTLTDTILDTEAPVLTSFTSTSPNGLYTSGQTINITANFGVALGAASTMTVVLNTGASVVLGAVSGNTLSGVYTVRPADKTPDLTVARIQSASVVDATGAHTNTSYSLPLSPQLTDDANNNLGDSANIVVGKNYPTIAVGVNPYQMTLVGQNLYVSNEGSASVSVVDTASNAVVATIPVGEQPYGIGYNAATKEVYVANIVSNTVSVIDADPTSLTYNMVTHTIAVGVRPFYVATAGARVYVTNNQSHTVSGIDTASHAVVDTIAVGTAPLGIKVLNGKLYVVNSNSSGGYRPTKVGTVSVVDTTNNTVINTIAVGAGPRGISVSGPDVYVANFIDNTVSVIDSTSGTVTHTIALGRGPRGMLTVGANIYVENWFDGTVSVINTNTHSVTSTTPVGGTPAGMAMVGGNIYISRFTDGVLTMLDTSIAPPTNLLVSGQVNPTKVDDPTPVFSATHNSLIGIPATHYRIQVSATSTFATIQWDSSKTALPAPVLSGEQANIAYTGSAFASSTLYYWRIHFWDASGDWSSWSTKARFTLAAETNIAPTSPTALQTEGQTNPINIPTQTPTLSALFNDPNTQDVAKKYRVQVATSTAFGDLWWDSGVLDLASSTPANIRANVLYAGPTLAASTTYYWRIKLLDASNVQSPWSIKQRFSLSN